MTFFNRTYYFILLTLLLFCPDNNLKAQIVFCPPGATWHYSFVFLPAFGGIYNYINEKITYVGDSIIGADTFKILSHRFYYSNCYNISYSIPKKTIIKQKGDTVFFRNERTQHSWQILYNYALTSAGSWTSNILKANNSWYTHTVTIDSVGQVIRNGKTLKRLYGPTGEITERFGSSRFLFNFHSYSGGCDGYFFAESLCYNDNTFGQISFSEKDCNYSGSVNVTSIKEEQKQTFKLFPNPTKDILYLPSTDIKIDRITIWTITGQKVTDELIESSRAFLNISDLSPGLYFINIETDGQQIRERILKY